MPAKNQIVADTKVVVDREAHALVLTRVVAAPREQVFEVWTRPEHVTCWWDPTGHPLKECEIDLRPAGAFRFVMGQTTRLSRRMAPCHCARRCYRITNTLATISG
jgi:uncharacterized protein YndB with AHSA1/START domain